jgi:peptidoglycan hydrolase FlgJ
MINLAGSAGVSPAQAAKPPESKQLKDLKKACEQFEAVFAKKLLSEMRKGVKEVQLGDAAGSEIYKDMMDQAIADSMAKQGALGIGKMLYKQFEKQVAGIALADLKAEPRDAGSSPNTPCGARAITISGNAAETATLPSTKR